MNQNAELYEYLKQSGDLEVLRDEPMSRHTTFRVGGPAEFFVTSKNENGIRTAFGAAEKYRMNIRVLGNGSNVLVPDEGVKGMVLKHGGNAIEISVDNYTVKAQSGALLCKLSVRAMESGLSGLEFAEGIPGSVGGAVYMNAGAYEGEISKVLISSTCITRDGKIAAVDNAGHEFGYRTSRIMRDGLMVLESVFKLVPGDKHQIAEKMKQLAVRRREKQPLEYPSAGSTFKRPEGYFAGKLIQDAGLGGHSVGGAMVSEKHCGFIVNKGNATAKDIMELIAYVSDTVEKKFGVRPEPEVKIWTL